MNSRRIILKIIVLAVLMGMPNAVLATNGHFLHGIGSISESLGGAGTAGNDQDLLGSLYRNPASGVLFDSSRFSVNAGVLFPKVTTNSSVGLLGLEGSTESETDYVPCANIGMVYRNGDSRTAYYLLIASEAGLGLDFPESSTNPVFMPQAGAANNPFGGLFGGFGRVKSQYELVRMPIGVSRSLNDHLQIGFALAPSVGRLRITPAAIAAPDDANGDGIPVYPAMDDNEIAFGFGFQGGIRYRATDALAFGLSVTSPTWFEDFEWDVADESGGQRSVSFRLDRPLSVEFGVSYLFGTGTALLLDMSWYNYKDTEGFEDSGFASDGSLAGFGWDDMWVFSLGVQHPVTDALTLRAGYSYCTNPIDEERTFFNVASPLHVQHNLSAGSSYRITENTMIDFAYTHTFKHSQSGPIYLPSGAVPGTEITTELEIDVVSLNISFEL